MNDDLVAEDARDKHPVHLQGVVALPSSAGHNRCTLQIVTVVKPRTGKPCLTLDPVSDSRADCIPTALVSQLKHARVLGDLDCQLMEAQKVWIQCVPAWSQQLRSWRRARCQRLLCGEFCNGRAPRPCSVRLLD